MESPDGLRIVVTKTLEDSSKRMNNNIAALRGKVNSPRKKEYQRVSSAPLLQDKVESPDRQQTLEDSSYGMNNNIAGWRGRSTHLDKRSIHESPPLHFSETMWRA